jgi:hypothetical protein
MAIVECSGCPIGTMKSNPSQRTIGFDCSLFLSFAPFKGQYHFTALFLRDARIDSEMNNAWCKFSQNDGLNAESMDNPIHFFLIAFLGIAHQLAGYSWVRQLLD